MIELIDTSPQIDVPAVEYVRLLGYPRDWTLEDRALELAQWARAWYAGHGHPWMFARQSRSLALRDGAVVIDDVPFASPRLFRMLEHADAESVAIVAVSAGPELEAEAQRLWRDDRPDEYFFLEVYGSAIVEHLVTMAGARLCAWADVEQMGVLPHDSPGYSGWTIADQPRLVGLAGRHGDLPGVLDVMESGMLRPKKSLVAVFGLTRRLDRTRRLTDLIPCTNCSYSACQYRRAPYRRGPLNLDPELSALAARAEAGSGTRRAPLTAGATYTTSVRALSRWTAERLTISARADGSTEARFHYDGTTCTNMGQPLAFDYLVVLGPPDTGYVIREQHCTPAPGDEGHQRMCGYLSNPEGLLPAIGGEAPLAGRPLDDVLTWSRPGRSTGCYCDADSRQHKWGLVLETIHFALARSLSPEP
jgi:hypothetical protein